MVSAMKRRAVEIAVSDHAVLRWLERAQGLNVGVVRRLIAGKVVSAAELGAVAVQLDHVRFVLRDGLEGAPQKVVVTTVLKLEQRRGLGNSDPGGGGDA